MNKKRNIDNNGNIIDSSRCGIYQVRCLANGKIIVGQSSNFHTRKMGYFSKLSRNVYDNPYLQSAYNKYKKENFVFEIIELCDILSLDDREVFWIKEKKSNNPEFGYNIASGGKAPRGESHPGWGKKRSVESRQRMSDAHKDPEYKKKMIPLLKQIFATEEYREKRRKINKLYMKSVKRVDKITGEILEIYESLSSAARQNNCGPSDISSVCKGKSKTAKGYKWSF